ncbi:hypothetical protein [Mycoplasma sp. P36-A1]|uniref:hypothetical protein n=1 Tax=Mycoplasma sp. P36-A1 TaxID=3252900 RepID=UPI003C2F8E7F
MEKISFKEFEKLNRDEQYQYLHDINEQNYKIYEQKWKKENPGKEVTPSVKRYFKRDRKSEDFYL